MLPPHSRVRASLVRPTGNPGLQEGADPAAPGRAAPPLELWGGIECSVVRIGDAWRDQVRETGHHDRPGDLDQVAGLGIRTLRVPLVWERLQAGGDAWRWHDERMERLRGLGVAPIAGLVHHGSGPAGTDLLDPGFPEALAVHAARVAERYPWITMWTPVNEPLTTARFSGLYGHWHPHACAEAAFLLMVATQCRAVLLAMRAVCARIPGARLVQTEDIGKTFSTARLSYQAGYENDRRWLSFDLLCGRVDRAHPWRGHLVASGVPEAWLDEFEGGEAAPDLMGVNYYVTGERFLDHRVGLYPAHMHGGNGRHAYVDTEAARVDPVHGALGWAARLREVWERYRRPIAVTEVHLGDQPEEQVRWLLEAWDAARLLRAEGADVRAVTVWSLFGAVDWDSLLRCCNGRYEAGAFDARHDPPRPTLLAEAAAALASTGRFDHPALDAPGWWRRDDRLHVRRSA